VYSFDIRNSRGTIDEVQVSAITGKVVRVEHESLKQEAAEKKKEAREKSESINVVSRSADHVRHKHRRPRYKP